MKNPNFYLKNGNLSKYGLSCGYVQGKRNVQLYMEHQCFHVVASFNNLNNTFVRISTQKLTLARKAFRKLVAGKKVEKHPEMSIYEQSNNMSL
jgi:hypothetical protein